MVFIDKLIYALLGLVVLMTIGMLTGSWRMILYAYLFIIGISIIFGLTRRIKSRGNLIGVPIGVSVLYVVLYVWLDVMTMGSPTGGEGLVWGMTPATALFMLGIWPASILVTLLYAWTFPVEEAMSENAAQKPDVKL